MSASFTAAGWSLSAGSGASRDRRASVRSFSLATPLGMGLEIASLAEGGRVLGLDGGIGLSLGGARTTLATLSGNRAVGAFLLSARATVGSTRATGSDTLRFAGDVISSALAVDGWLFPGQHYLKPLSTRQIYRVVVEAGQAAGIGKRVGPHTLRHCFATHLLEDGIDVRIIQALLGHAKLETTAYYTQVATRVLRNVTSPFDRLATVAMEARTSSG